MGGMFSEKSDGYSFGFLQLEIISGKKNTNFYSSDQHIGFLAYYLFTDRRGLERLLGVEAMMPSLQDPERFNLWGAKVNRDGLVTLMHGCKDLVMLDARDCSGFDENDDEISKIASHISQFKCDGFEFPECLCGMDNFVLHVDGYSFHLHVEETWDEMLNDLRNAFNDLGDEE
ncbi:unnamed protein product [Prunus armeniaca]